MAASQSDESDYSVGRFLWMIGNALRWKCPTCGERAIFVPWYKVRSLENWFMPLDGCPKCGYPYEREPGYFLLSIFAINYGVAALLGVIIYLVLDFWVRLPIGVTLLLTIIPIPLFNLWFARHSKTLFLAFDLFFDPHHRDRGDGDQPVAEPDRVPKDPHSQPVRR
jgi:predicted RNA-binding Zn-ribbon protein involved in translation (DUF1610 family)